MNPSQKPGWQTSELYAACGAQIAAFVVAMSDTDMTAKIVTGAIAGISLAGYIYTRFALKSPVAAPPPTEQPKGPPVP